MPENLKQFRRAISQEWLPFTGRKRLTSSEYALIAQWFDEQVPVNLILRAIADVVGRGAVVYSLGVIKADLESLRRSQGRLQAGAHTPDQRDWRAKITEEVSGILEDLAEMEESLAVVEAYSAIKAYKNTLPHYSNIQAEKAWKEIEPLLNKIFEK